MTTIPRPSAAGPVGTAARPPTSAGARSAGAEPVSSSVVTGPTVTGPTVTGDGTTAAGRAGGRWRRWRWPVGVAAALVVVAVLAALPQPRTSDVALAPDNPAGAGARALAQVLGQQGVQVDYVRTSAQAVAAARAGTTLLVTGDALLSDAQVDAIAGTRADLVLVDPGWTLSRFTGGAATEAWPGTGGTDALQASCTDPAAAAAGSISADAAGAPGFSGTAFVARTPAATVCFPIPGDEQGAGAYVAVQTDRSVTGLGSGRLLTNAAILEEGNAALALRVLGRQPQLTWYVPSADDARDPAARGSSVLDLLPGQALPVALLALVVVAVAAGWRGRRLGRVVTEPLPVVVRAAETTRGRGRSYRRSGAHGRAAAALRAGTADRTAHRLGLARSASAPAVIDALARATGRPPAQIADVLYGPPPIDDAGLARLARALSELENEVHG